MEKTLKFYKGVNKTPFPSTEGQIEIGEFRYDAKRMGGAPSISATVMHPTCLDDEWGDDVYVEFNHEKYFLKQTPTSSYSNEDERYKHIVELISERVILDNVYFFDAVVGEPQGDDKPVSNSTKVMFFGDVREFVGRLNASLEYAKLLKWEDAVDEEGNTIKTPNGYHVVVDEEIQTEEKLMSFEDQFFSNVLQEIYNTYEVPYYFEGKTIHIGWAKSNVVIPTLGYGVDDALLSISKNNANQKVVNRITGKGSTDNIPFYYPNNSPKGDIEAEVNTTSDDFEVEIIDRDLYADKVDVDSTIERTSIDYVVQSIRLDADNVNALFSPNDSIDLDIRYKGDPFRFNVEISGQSSNKGEVYFELFLDDFVIYNGDVEYPQQLTEFVVYAESQVRSVSGDYYFSGFSSRQATAKITNDINSTHVKLPFVVDGNAEQKLRFKIVMNPFLSSGRFTCKMRVKEVDSDGWVLGEKKIDLKDVGLRSNGLANIGDTITQRLVKYVNTSQNLMPSVYRATDGAERFYNAINYPFLAEEGYELKYGEYLKNEDGEGNETEEDYVHNDNYKDEHGDYYHFNNPYVEGRPKEHTISIEDLKPTIKEATNNVSWVETDEEGNQKTVFQRMDMFSEFAYDLDDNDETVEGDNEGSRDFVHSYFFAKLRKLDFNLFDHAIENQPMTISFTSGDCGACNFEIGVTEEFPQKNPVQVDENGNLVRDENGRVVCGQFAPINESQCQARQQDTINNEVWIALKKEESTYGILMPKATIYEEDGVTVKEAGHRPKGCTWDEEKGVYLNDGDTFVILGIHLPDTYITNAEKGLEAEMIKQLKENNDEKFTFNIGFSRIYFEENATILDQLNENSKIRITYNGIPYDLYVSSFSYNMSEGDVLPEIRVELDDTLKVSQNVFQNAISQVKSELGKALSNMDVVGIATPYFIRKDVDDIANGNINFTKGIKFGEGGKVEVLDNNSAKLTIEYLEVTKKASFTSLEIKEKTHVGGQIIISPAAMTCGEVEELEDAYRCYFQTRGENDGEEIFNQFAENDLAICQTYNAWGSRYYWRKVVGIGEDYIDLSKTLCDEYSDVPMAGDKIVQLGNTTDITRQAAQVLSAYGEDAPSFIMYNGINDFTLVDKNITGIIWNPNTLEPQMYSYGSFFFGDGTTDENGNLIGENFITFQKRDGDTEKKLHINATVNFSSDSTGLSNLEEWKGVQSEISGINKTIEQVQDQIDGVVENWNGEGTPTLTNEPAVNWLTDAEKIAHINDTYINIEEYVDDETTPTSGQAWRWCKCTNESITDFVIVTDKDGEILKLHWHPIADSDAVRALRELATKADKSDLDVLTKNLKDGSTIVDGGLVMTSMVAVGSANESNIEAFLNGSDFAEDAENGKLILAGGIPTTSKSGSVNLEDRAKEAKIKMYEDGDFVMKGGGISVERGNIGPFYIGGTHTLASNEKSPLQDTKVILDTTSMAVVSEDKEDNSDISISIGSKISSTYGALYDADGNSLFSINHSTIRGVKIEANDDGDDIRGVLEIKRGGSGSKCAIAIDGGYIGGLRPRTRTIVSSSGLTKLDHTIMVISQSALTLTLPDNPEVGQEYDIYFAFNTEINYPLKSNDISIHWPVADIWGVKQTNITGKGVIKIICAKDQNGSKLWWVYRLA